MPGAADHAEADGRKGQDGAACPWPDRGLTGEEAL